MVGVRSAPNLGGRCFRLKLSAGVTHPIRVSAETSASGAEHVPLHTEPRDGFGAGPPFRREARAAARGASSPGPLCSARHFVANERLNDASLHARAELDPDAFWAEQARALDWHRPFTTVLDDSNPPFYKWFSDGTLNVSYNCVDRHVEAGRGNRVAFYWAGEQGEERAITYAALYRDVQRLANALKALGIRKGNVVGIYLPMIPEVVVAMLACARLGAPHNVVFGGFAPEAVKERMEVSRAKVLITVDGARRKGKTAPVKAAVDAVMGDLASLEHIVVVRHAGIDMPMSRGSRRVLRRDPRRRGPGLPGRADGGRAPAVHPLQLPVPPPSRRGSSTPPAGI